MDEKSVGVNVVSKNISGFLLTWPIKQKDREIALTYCLITIFKMVYFIGDDRPSPLAVIAILYYIFYLLSLAYLRV